MSYILDRVEGPDCFLHTALNIWQKHPTLHMNLGMYCGGIKLYLYPKVFIRKPLEKEKGENFANLLSTSDLEDNGFGGLCQPKRKNLTILHADNKDSLGIF